MAGVNLNKKIFKSILAYSIAVVLCLMIFIWVMELWKADLNIPFKYSGDALCTGMSIKSIVDNGWFLHNNYLGMPTGLDMHDFPTADNFHFFLIKIISLFSSDFAFIMNFYFILTFPLTTLTSLYVFRQFNLSDASSIVASLLFTFLPYHFLRGETHLFLASYFMIPLMVMVILWLFTEKSSFLFYCDSSSDKKKFKLNFKSIASIVICLLVASTGLYYAIFAGFFLLIAGLHLFIFEREKFSLLKIDTLIAFLIIGAILNILPSMVYIYNHGSNPGSFIRSPIGSEVYGMKIDQLLMPVDGHRISYLSELKDKYNKIAPLVNENGSSSLGLIGGLGFIVLIGTLFNKSSKNCIMSLYKSLSMLNISAVLLATIGGFGYFFAIIIPGIRCYNRISVYIAFFSLFAINIILDNVYRKYVKTNIKRYTYYGFLGFILLIGILDQTNKTFVPPYELLKSEYTSDSEFIGRIEASLPTNAMVFQLPYMSFPESPPVFKMGDYELFRGYLHSNNIRWSYGTMKGREGEQWQQKVAEKPLNEFLETLSLAGFSGIYLDRNGYDGMGFDIEEKLSILLDEDPIVSLNNRLVFFNMENYNKNLKEKYTERELELKKNSNIYRFI